VVSLAESYITTRLVKMHDYIVYFAFCRKALFIFFSELREFSDIILKHHRVDVMTDPRCCCRIAIKAFTFGHEDQYSIKSTKVLVFYLPILILNFKFAISKITATWRDSFLIRGITRG
jgi:hypothetical protein